MGIVFYIITETCNSINEISQSTSRGWSSGDSITSEDDPNDPEWSCGSSDSLSSDFTDLSNVSREKLEPLPFDTVCAMSKSVKDVYVRNSRKSKTNHENDDDNEDKSYESDNESCASNSSECSRVSLPFDTNLGAETTASGLTRNKQRAAGSMATKHEKHTLSMRQSGLFFPWAAANSKRKIFTKMKNKINELYMLFLSFGAMAMFNKYGIQNAASEVDCKKALNICSNQGRKLKQKKQKNRLSINHPIPFMTVDKFGVDQFDNITNREFMQREETIAFEHEMNSLHLNVCSICLEYELLFEKNSARKEYDVCSKCKDNKEIKDKSHYIKMNRQPVWYEYNADGTKVCDENGVPIPQYHIPEELSNLTMAEKLLIRRFCPFIPSVHLKNGTMGLKGHCVCFPQDVNEVCNTLPQLKCQVVKYIREIGNGETSEHRFEMLRVNRVRVLAALRWLQIHNSEYSNINIDESNLDWMNGKSECNLDTVDYVFNMTPKKIDIVEQEEGVTVSDRQCFEEGDADELPMLTVRQNQQVYRPGKEEVDMIKDIRKTALDSGHAECVLDFPAIDNINPVR